MGFGSNDFDIFRLGGALTKLGWNLNNLQFPSGIHICITLRHTEKGVADQFINDVKRCTAEIMEKPREKATGSAAIYGMAQSIPDRSLVKEIALHGGDVSGFVHGTIVDALKSAVDTI